MNTDKLIDSKRWRLAVSIQAVIREGANVLMWLSNKADDDYNTQRYIDCNLLHLSSVLHNLNKGMKSEIKRIDKMENIKK